jgi:O-antigen biosynthesis protein WbqP
VGKDNGIFLMPKFRTMRTDAPQVATHLLKDPGQYITRVGRFLRKTSLDELPQLISVLKGDLSLVGPRPALFNQSDLISMRTQAGVDRLMPGITGLAQVNGRDDLEISVKVRYDTEYANTMSLANDLKIIGLTVVKVFRREGVRH